MVYYQVFARKLLLRTASILSRRITLIYRSMIELKEKKKNTRYVAQSVTRGSYYIHIYVLNIHTFCCVQTNISAESKGGGGGGGGFSRHIFTRHYWHIQMNTPDLAPKMAEYFLLFDFHICPTPYLEILDPPLNMVNVSLMISEVL